MAQDELPLCGDGPLHPVVTEMLRRARAAAVPAFSEGSPAQARAVMAGSRLALGTGPEVRKVQALRIPTRSGSIPGLLLLPFGEPLGVCTYLHGGGWVVGEPADFEAVARNLTVRSGCAVVVPDYRLAPEHPFPAAVEDCEDAVLWCARMQGELLGRSVPLLVAGDSAGGNLAAVVARRLQGQVALAGQLLIYPVTDADFETPSYHRYGQGLALTRADMIWFFRHYAAPELWADPAISPLRAAGLTDLPPAVVVLAGHDVLRDEGERYAQRLEEIGRLVARRCYADLPHGFLRLHNLVDTADRALSELAADMRRLCLAAA